MTNFLIATDAYHHNMAYLLGDEALQLETHILYARSGGPLVVANLSKIIKAIAAWQPTRQDVESAYQFWADQGVAFPRQQWLSLIKKSPLPIYIRGVQDSEVVLPGEPIAVVQAPALLAGILEPVLISHTMKASQVATRFTKLAHAVNWQTHRLFEVGMRAAMSSEEHVETVEILTSLGLKMSSSGLAAQHNQIRSGGTMGHRYTQRFTSDYQAFEHALNQMLKFKVQNNITEKVPLSWLLDTRSTLHSGFPAALRLMEQRAEDIGKHINLSLRVDSGDLLLQVCTMMQVLNKRFPQQLPSIIVESGLTAEKIRLFEDLAHRLHFPKEKLLYGVGAYLTSGISRDHVSMVYKVSSFAGTPTMKFADDPNKQSYPGNISLMEKNTTGGAQRLVVHVSEVVRYRTLGWQELFVDLLKDGLVLPQTQDLDSRLAFISMTWQRLAKGYLGEDKYPKAFPKRPRLSPWINETICELSDSHLGEHGSVYLSNKVANCYY